MSGADPATIRTTLEKRHTRSELKEMLGEELGATYPQEVTQSLRNDLMEAFFRTVGVDPSEVDLPFETTTYDALLRPEFVAVTAVL